MKYKVVVYKSLNDLETGLNTMDNEGYEPVSIDRGHFGITVVYKTK